MIQFADEHTELSVRQMWKICFEDSDEFMDLYFSRKYKNSDTLLYIEDGVAVASLQMLPYDMRFYGVVIPTAYISGACTLPEYRGRGYMKELLLASYKVMQQRKIPISFLIPAEDWLYGFYAKYGYERVFDDGRDPLDMDTLLKYYPDNLDSGFEVFNEKYQQQDFCVLKTKNDFQTILEEYILYGCPPKYDLAGMARIIDPQVALQLFAKKNPSKEFTVKVTDQSLNPNRTYSVKEGVVSPVGLESADFDVNIQTLTRLLFGYKLREMSPQTSNFFDSHHPVMNLMLE